MSPKNRFNAIHLNLNVISIDLFPSISHPSNFTESFKHHFHLQKIANFKNPSSHFALKNQMDFEYLMKRISIKISYWFNDFYGLIIKRDSNEFLKCNVVKLKWDDCVKVDWCCKSVVCFILFYDPFFVIKNAFK